VDVHHPSADSGRAAAVFPEIFNVAGVYDAKVTYMKRSIITGLILLLTLPAWVQGDSLVQAPEVKPREPLRLSQAVTMAVCGDTCDCGRADLVMKQYGPCTVNATTGSCHTGSGACCVCAAADTVAVCGEDTCDCGNAWLITKVPAPCSATSNAGECRVGSGECCVCTAN
jgi:hypothetical protein